MDENLKISADGEWMKKNIEIFGKKKIYKIISNFYTGGLTTNPSVKSIKVQSKFSLKEGIKETSKYILSKIFKEDYFNVVFKKKFYIK